MQEQRALAQSKKGDHLEAIAALKALIALSGDSSGARACSAAATKALQRLGRGRQAGQEIPRRRDQALRTRHPLEPRRLFPQLQPAGALPRAQRQRRRSQSGGDRRGRQNGLRKRAPARRRRRMAAADPARPGLRRKERRTPPKRSPPRSRRKTRSAGSSKPPWPTSAATWSRPRRPGNPQSASPRSSSGSTASSPRGMSMTPPTGSTSLRRWPTCEEERKAVFEALTERACAVKTKATAPAKRT